MSALDELLARGELSVAAPYNTSAASSCDLCATRWLFIASVGGRTGSTSLLDMVNAHPAFSLAGETEGGAAGVGMLSYAMSVWDGAADKDATKAASDTMGRGEADVAELLCGLQRSILATSLEAGETLASVADKVRGFKEVRWAPPGLGERHGTRTRDLTSMLRFVEALFPCSRVIFSDRAEDEADSSIVLTPDDEAAAVRRAWRPYAAALESWHGYWMDVANFSVGEFNSLLRWAGEPRAEEGGCEFTGVLHANDGGYSDAAPGSTVLDSSACKFS